MLSILDDIGSLFGLGKAKVKVKKKDKKGGKKKSKTKQITGEFKALDPNDNEGRSKLAKKLYKQAKTKSEKDQRRKLYRKEKRLAKLKIQIEDSELNDKKLSYAKEGQKKANKKQKAYWDAQVALYSGTMQEKKKELKKKKKELKKQKKELKRKKKMGKLTSAEVKDFKENAVEVKAEEKAIAQTIAPIPVSATPISEEEELEELEEFEEGEKEFEELEEEEELEELEEEEEEGEDEEDLELEEDEEDLELEEDEEDLELEEDEEDEEDLELEEDELKDE